MDTGRAQSLFWQLVQTDSPSLSERAVADLCKRRLEALGFEVFEDQAGQQLGGNAGNLIAILPGEPGVETLLLTSHMDTVQPGTGIRPRLDADGVAWSDGTTILGADDKAGLTAILLGLEDLVASGSPRHPVQVVFTIAEELGLQGSKALDPNRLQATMGLCLDSGGPVGTMVTAGPAQVRWEAEFIGRSAHAGVAPEQGISAISVAAKAVSKMPHGRIDFETTVNVGRFVGEGPSNVVRDKVTLAGEARSRNPEKLERVLTDMERVFSETADAEGAVVRFESQPNYSGFRFDEHTEVRRRAEDVLRSLGFIPNAVEGGGGSDANIFTGYGIPTLNIGLGYADIHGTNEHVALADIMRAAQVVTAFCRVAAP